LAGVARADTDESDPPRREIRLVEQEGGTWSAIDEEAGMASQDETRSEALANLTGGRYRKLLPPFLTAEYLF
jgi:hypothetical protein